MNFRAYALTYPQLMNQAIAAGLTSEELQCLRRGYECAQRLFDGVYRGQHAPFITHVTRTASILLAEGEPLSVVIAGLTHAVYTHGTFEDFRYARATEAHRAQMRREVGEEVEALVMAYDRCLWYQRECVREHLGKMEQSSDRQKHLLMMRLANELEDYLDLSMAYRGLFPYKEKLEAYGKEAVEMAQRLGHPILAAELEEVFRIHMSLRLPEELITLQRGAYQLPMLKWLKRSYRERLQIRARQFLGRFMKEALSQ